MTGLFPGVLLGIALVGLTACGGGGGGSSSGARATTPVADVTFGDPVRVATIGAGGDAGTVTAIKPMKGALFVETNAGGDIGPEIWSNRESSDFFSLPFPGALSTSVFYKNRLFYHSDLPVSTRDVRDGIETVTVYASDGTVHGTESVWFMNTEFEGSNGLYYWNPGRIDEDWDAFTSMELLPADGFLGYRLRKDERGAETGLVLANDDEVDAGSVLATWSDFYLIEGSVSQGEDHFYFVHMGGTDYGGWVGDLIVCDEAGILRRSGCTYVFQDDWERIKPMAVFRGKAVFLGYGAGWGIFSEDLANSSLEPLFPFGLQAFNPEEVITPAMEKLFDGSNFSVSGDYLYFAINAEDAGQPRSRIYRSDGTEAGTLLLADIGYSVDRLMAAGDEVYCVVQASGGEALVYVAGLSGSAELLESFPVFTKAETVANAGSLIFAHTTEQYGSELWFINGPTMTSNIVYDLVEGAGSSDPSVLTMHESDLYFTTGDSGDLWRLRLD